MQILADEITCFQCPNGSLPDSNKTACVELPVQHLELTSIWGIIPVIFSSFGIVITLFVVAVFMRYDFFIAIRKTYKKNMHQDRDQCIKTQFYCNTYLFEI